MVNAKKEIKNMYKDVQSRYQPVLDIIDRRWENQLQMPLHVAGYYLNPQMQHNLEDVLFNKSTFYKCLETMCGDENLSKKIDLQLDLFKKSKGLFNCSTAKLTRKEKSLADWWDSFGDDTSELKQFAIRVLSLTCSLLGFERNWSAFEMVHSKRRNRLQQQEMNDLMYVMYDLKLSGREERKRKEEDFDFEDVDSDDEWITKDNEDLTNMFYAMSVWVNNWSAFWFSWILEYGVLPSSGYGVLDFVSFMVFGIESSNSVRRPKSKGTKSKNRVLKNTKSSSAYVRKISRSGSIDSNKCDTKDSNVCQTNASVSNSMTVNDVNGGSNNDCVSFGKDVFLLSHEKCVARYALSRNSNFMIALFTTCVAAKSKNLGVTSVVLVLWIVNSGCSKHMTGNLQLLRNFVEKFMGTVRFRNDHFATITGYKDYVQGYLTICHVYYVEGLGHNLFLVRQFGDGDLEVAFHSNTCYVRNLEGGDLLTGSHDSNLYTISITKMAASSPVCLMSRATLTKSWLWHRRLSHLNFGTINQLTSKDLVDGLLKFKYNKDHLCSAYEQGKSKKDSVPPKLVPSIDSKLKLLHIDLCGCQ
uniref:Zf-BED domain-containing protein n=1 Tax=Tanacetum cinerariifolium TaxID=118510 RepID=A0A6L2MFC1_TANCI|nr:zf-BED domain-containing protein [Tanacetum cinerariifolium]